MPESRRRSGRTPLDVRVELRTDDHSNAGVARNIGIGGLFVATEDLRPVGERLALRFMLPGHCKPISVEGEVRWVRAGQSPPREDLPEGMGFRFVDLSIAAWISILEFLRARELARRSGDGSEPR